MNKTYNNSANVTKRALCLIMSLVMFALLAVLCVDTALASGNLSVTTGSGGHVHIIVTKSDGTKVEDYLTSGATTTSLASGDTITLNANPVGTTFAGWEGDVTAAQRNSAYLSISYAGSGNLSFTATFGQTPPPQGTSRSITQSSSQTLGSVSFSTHSAVAGDPVTVTANPSSSRYALSHWEIINTTTQRSITPTTSGNSATFIMQDGNVTVRAVFYDTWYGYGPYGPGYSWSNSDLYSIYLNYYASSWLSWETFLQYVYAGYYTDQWWYYGSGWPYYGTDYGYWNDGWWYGSTVNNVTTRVNNSGWGTASASRSSAARGSTVTVTARPNSGYRFAYWEVVSGNISLSNIYSSSATFTMPSSGNVSVRAVFEVAGRSNVTATVNNSSWGSAVTNLSNAAPGSMVTLTASPFSGYRFSHWEVLTGNAAISNINSPVATFTMPSGSVSVRAVFDGSWNWNWNTISARVNNPSWGSATASAANAAVGTAVTLQATPFAGYRFVRWETVSGSAVVDQEFSPTTTFIMPNGSVDIRAVFTEIPGMNPAPPLTGGFDSVSPMGGEASMWARYDVDIAIGFGIVPPQLQSQYTRNITRAEFCALAVAMYERITRREITGREAFFDTNDVNVQKAAAIGLIFGVGGGRFAPDSILTREQAAAIMVRLATLVGRPLPSNASGFSVDFTDVSDWARTSVSQIQGAGVMRGVGGSYFAPRDACTREQSIVSMLRLFNMIDG